MTCWLIHSLLKTWMVNPVGTQRVDFCGLFLRLFDCVPGIVQKPVIICPSKIKIKAADLPYSVNCQNYIMIH